MMATIILISAGILLLLITVLFYNKFVKFRNRIRNAWSDVDVQLKRRADLVPALVETVKGYAGHEKELQERLAAIREKRNTTSEIPGRAAESDRITNFLRDIFVNVENYPELLADKGFRQLQENLVEIEYTLQMARRYYNAVVRDNNIAVESFPGLLFARLFGFRTAEFFEAEELDRNVILVKFS